MDSNKKKRKDKRTDIKDHPEYGSKVRYWIYSPPKQKWIIFPTVEGSTFHFSEDDKTFIKSLSLLQLGAFLFKDTCDPNESLEPIILFEEFLDKHDIIQAFLNDEGDLDLMRAVRRDFDNQARIEAAERKLEKIQEKRVSTEEKLFSHFSNFVPVKQVSQRVLKKAVNSGYTVIYSEDKSEVKLQKKD